MGEIVDQLHFRQPQVSKHLRVLSEAGIVVSEPVAQKRIYKLQAKPFQELDAWLNDYRKMWEERLDRLEAYLEDVQQGGITHGKRRKHGRKSGR